MTSLIGGLVGLGVSAISGASQRKQASQQQAAQNQQISAQNAIADSNAGFQRQMESMQVMQQANANAVYKQQQAFSAKQKAFDGWRAKEEAQSAMDKIPIGDGALKGLGTIQTSPLGDTTDPFLGRQRLLGG